ncbi:hypothetical protein HID58_070660 [Brassica napus]|uniref:F-box associated beta-propeller type 3 domain-containing protein n=1 Tax=Brassica napus TaxID=3708 RepID=A0ABQ7YZH6_BRANA|nr:hypothetical protein HID58_070660 [Brassica napus]
MKQQRPRSAVICNPSTGESLTLPEVSTERIDKRSYFIGYDPIQQQFKHDFLYYLAYISMISRVTTIVRFGVKSEVFSFIDMDEGMSISSSSCTLINYKGWIERDLEMFILEDVGKHIWSHTYELSLLWKSKNESTELHIVGVTGTCDIVFSPYFLSDPLYVSTTISTGEL